MSNYYAAEWYCCNHLNACYISDPLYIGGCYEWLRREFNGTCFNIFVTPRTDQGGGVDIHACEAEIVQSSYYRDFLAAFDWALTGCPIVSSGCPWLAPACCQVCTIPDELTCAFNFANAPVRDYCSGCFGLLRDWQGFRGDYDIVYPFLYGYRERMRGQVDFWSMWVNWGKCDQTGDGCVSITLYDCRVRNEDWLLKHCCDYFHHGFSVYDGVAKETIKSYQIDDGVIGCNVPIRVPECAARWVWMYEAPYAEGFVCLSTMGGFECKSKILGEPYDGGNYIYREPCETDAVLYFGLPNFAIGSLPIKRLKCTLKTTPNSIIVANSNINARCWTDRVQAYAMPQSQFTFCFITFPSAVECCVFAAAKMLQCGVFYYLCSYKCASGQYIAMCPNSVAMITADVCGAKMIYYTFQGYSIGGAAI